MIDINEVLRRALMEARVKLDEELRSTWSTTRGGIDIPVSATARGEEIRIDLRRRPDGVWEMPE